MFITIAGMTTILAVGSVAIDTASWYRHHHHVQMAADAAALAAANCLADGGSTGNVCTSTTDTTDAAQVASQIASDNGVAIPASAVSFTGKEVTVKGSEKVKSVLAEVAGIQSVQPSAGSGATWDQSVCTTSNSSCYAIFAYNATCNTADSTSAGAPGVTNSGNSSVIHGGVHSNGNIYNNGNQGNGTFPNYSSWGVGCLSSNNDNPGLNSSVGSSTLPYPIDFSGLSPAADNNDAMPPACTYTAGVTGATTGVTWNASTKTLTVGSGAPSGVYCNTTGTINITANGAAGGYNTPGGDTYIAAAFTGLSNNNISLSSYNNGSANPYNLLLYQVSPYWNGTTCSRMDSSQLTLGGNTKQVVQGIVFAPCSSIVQYDNNSGDAMFLEGYNVNLMGNATFSGLGPSPTSNGLHSGTDQLNQ